MPLILMCHRVHGHALGPDVNRRFNLESSVDRFVQDLT